VWESLESTEAVDALRVNEAFWLWLVIMSSNVFGFLTLRLSLLESVSTALDDASVSASAMPLDLPVCDVFVCDVVSNSLDLDISV